MTFFKVIFNIAKIKTILEAIYLFLNKINDPKDFEEFCKHVNVFQSGLETVLKILGSNVDSLREIKKENIILANIVKNEQEGIV
jgi:hypothetical protein